MRQEDFANMVYDLVCGNFDTERFPVPESYVVKDEFGPESFCGYEKALKPEVVSFKGTKSELMGDNRYGTRTKTPRIKTVCGVFVCLFVPKNQRACSLYLQKVTASR